MPCAARIRVQTAEWLWRRVTAQDMGDTDKYIPPNLP